MYAKSKNNFALVSDKDNNIYLAKIENVITNNLSDKKDLSNYKKLSNNKIRNDLYSSYDLLMNVKYKIDVNQNTLERLKNHFR